MSKVPVNMDMCPCAPDQECLFAEGEQHCQLLDNAGVPREPRWRSLLMAMASAGELQNLTDEQKERIEEHYQAALASGNFSVPKYRTLLQQHEAIIAEPYQRKLKATLDETTKLLGEVRSMAQGRHGDVKKLQSQAVDAVESGKDPAETVAMLRNAFTEVLSSMEKDVEDLGRISRTDVLTGLNNRRALDEYLDELEESWKQGKFPVSLLMIDIDHFKKFNDTYGHRVGDQALAAVARHIRAFGTCVSSSRDFQYFPARYGGEEFCVVMPNVPLGNAAEFAEELRKRIEGHKLRVRTGEEVVAKGIRVTVSIGVAAMKARWQSACAVNLIEEADKALYRAKDAGRNRVDLMALEE